MPGLTVPYSLPYPLPAELTGPQPVQDLAEAVDDLAVQTSAALEAANTGIIVGAASGGPATVVAGSGSVVCFNSEVLDTGDVVRLDTNPCELVLTEDGIWLVSANVTWAAESGAGPRGSTIRLNGLSVARSVSDAPADLSTGGWTVATAWYAVATAGDTVSLQVDHGTGTVGVTTRTCSYFRLLAVKVA